jgi:hypothetical protein
MTIAVFVELLFAIAQLIAAASFICDQLPVKKVGVACCHDFGRAYTARRFGGSDAREDNEWMFTAQRPQQRVRQSVSSTARQPRQLGRRPSSVERGRPRPLLPPGSSQSRVRDAVRLRRGA